MRINKYGLIERARETKKVLGCVRSARRYSVNWCCVGLVVATSCVGCSHMKTMGATSGVVAATGLLTGGAVVPTAVAGGVTAATVSALTAKPQIQAAEIKADTVVNKAPDTVWTLLGKLIEIGGWGLLIFLAATYILPMLFTYLLPGPLERKKK